MLKSIVTMPGYRGIRHNDLPFPQRLHVFAGDTETVRGKAYSLQLCDDMQPYFIRVTDDTILDEFLDWIERRILSGHVAVMYFHNLEYDMSVLLNRYHEKFLGRKRIIIHHRGWKIDAVMSGTCFAKFRKEKKSLLCLDSARFMQVSLARFAEIIGSKERKLDRPDYIGERKPTKDEFPSFVEYALTDVKVQKEVADWIVRQHRRYNVRISYSAAHFSERIFRHYHLMSHERIYLPPKEWREYCVLSYHGGKNGLYLPSKKGVYLLRDGAEVDITSAYPYAMANLPNMVRCWYKETDCFDDKREGIYRVWGVCKNDRYPVLYSHDFKPIPYGERLDGLCVTSYELREALRTGEIVLERCCGILAHPDERYQHNPLKEFVTEFFELKAKAKNSDEKQLYKIILNSLYGKFIQAVEIEDDEKSAPLVDVSSGAVVEKAEKKYRAGLMYHPFIASLITGFVRVYLHQLEHYFNAVHSSTDSVIFKWSDRYKSYIEARTGLGGLELKVRGNCYIIRNKVYVWTDDKGKILKYATHGISLDGASLLDMVKKNIYEYKVKKMVKVREALRRKEKPLVPLAMQYVEKSIQNVDFSRIIPL